MFRNHESIYVVLDALDESLKRSELLSWVKEVTSTPELTHLQLLCTGRPEVEFNRELPALIEEDNCIQLDRDAIDADIDSYVIERLSQSPDFNRWAGYPKVLDQIRSSIGHRSGGM